MADEDPGPEAPVLSGARLGALCEAVGEQAPLVFPRLLEIFRRDAPARLSDLRGALAVGDAERVAHAAHGLKSGAGNLGIERVRLLSERLEAAGRAGQLKGAAELLGALGPAIEAGAAALESWMAENL